MENKGNLRDYYELIKKISMDSFGTTYKSQKKDTKEKRAIKIIDLNRLMDDLMKNIYCETPEEEMNKFRINKIKMVKNMNIMEGKNKENSNTVEIYEYFNSKNEFAIVMELCDSNLEEIIKEKKRGLNSNEILLILNQLNNSFKIMNDNKIIHRDLKLANILIKYDNKDNINYKIKLSGYDVSIKMKDEFISGEIVGTLNYMAPELLSEEVKYNEKCDLWSLGVIIYILYFKHYPYSGDTFRGIYNKIKRCGKTILKKTDNPDLDNLISGLLTPEPNKRLSWKEYFEHPFFKNNSKIYFDSKINIQKDDNEKKKIDINNNKKENYEIKTTLIPQKNEDEKLIKRIAQLENELKEEKNKNMILEGKIRDMKKELDEKKNQIKDLNQNNEIKNIPSLQLDSKEELYKTILQKDKELDEYKKQLARYPFELKQGEKLMTVNFITTDNKIQHYSLICKNTDIFNVIEKKLYEDYKEYYDTENYFTVNGNRIHKYKNLDENNIHNNDVVILNILEI